MIKKISSIKFSCNCVRKQFDEEHLRIMKLLQKYCITPTGNKSTDKMLLHSKELEEAKKENCTTTKFLTISKNEQEKIQEKKKEKKEDINPDLELNPTKGQEILGQQIMISIDMKQKNK